MAVAVSVEGFRTSLERRLAASHLIASLTKKEHTLDDQNPSTIRLVVEGLIAASQGPELHGGIGQSMARMTVNSVVSPRRPLVVAAQIAAVDHLLCERIHEAAAHPEEVALCRSLPIAESLSLVDPEEVLMSRAPAAQAPAVHVLA